MTGPGGGRPSPTAADVTVVGEGVIGLAVALALADAGCAVCLIGEPRPGAASPAAAGLLAPSVETPAGGASGALAHRFALAARDRYPGYVADLAERSGVAVPLNRLGILEVALTDDAAGDLRARGAAAGGEGSRFPGGEWLDRAALGALEPGLAHLRGALLHAGDGAVDNVALLRALETAIECCSRITRVQDAVVSLSIAAGGPVRSITAGGEAYDAERVVLAAGAWVSRIAGLPRPLPVEPVRGQMFDVSADGEAARLRHAVFGPRAYLVPRGPRLLVGATMEHVGFDARTTDAAIDALADGARELWPAIGRDRMVSRWAGLRPVTPDLLPIIGADPEFPAVLYACGHSRNGILMAPLSADCVAALVRGTAPPADLAPFAVDRFRATDIAERGESRGERTIVF